MNKKSLLRIFLIFILTISSMLISGEKAEARKGISGTLPENTNITRYDLDGDGKKDNIWIDTEMDEYNRMTTKTEIYINGRFVLSDDRNYYGSNCRILTIGDSLYLYYAPMENNNDGPNRIYYFNGKKLKCVFDKYDYCGEPYGFHPYVKITNVTKKKISVTFSIYDYSFGWLDYKYDFIPSNTKFKPSTSMSKDLICHYYKDDSTYTKKKSHYVTLSVNCPIYGDYKCKVKKGQFAPNTKIELIGIIVKGSYRSIKVRRISDGKEGFVKLRRSYGTTYISNPFFAG